MAYEHNEYGESDSIFMYHMPCEHCGSSDGNSMWSDGHQWCYVCETWLPPEGGSMSHDHKETYGLERSDTLKMFECQGHFTSLNKRGIDKETCQKYGY